MIPDGIIQFHIFIFFKATNLLLSEIPIYITYDIPSIITAIPIPADTLSDRLTKSHTISPVMNTANADNASIAATNTHLLSVKQIVAYFS